MNVRRVLLSVLIFGQAISTFALPKPVIASGQTVLISEVQTTGSGTGHAGDEFVELYNPSPTDVSLAKWTLQYRPATSTSGSDCSKGWTTKATLVGTIKSHSYYLVAATGYLTTADARFAAGLAQSGGAVRLVDGSSVAVDAVAWGQGTLCGHGTAAIAVLAGQSLERRPGDDLPLGGNAVDTGDNSADFVARAVPEPQSTLSSAEDPADYPNTPLTDTAVVSPAATYLPLQINELLVDPVSPQTDDHDEFIELYNPNAEPVDAVGYQLKTVSSTFHLAHQIIPAGGYLVITSANSTISLTNSGGSLQLMDPVGDDLGAAVSWGQAIAGAGWDQAIDGSWAWSTTLTPENANIITAPVDTVRAKTSASDNVPGGPYAGVVITELLPNPGAPQTDANDEFVELYNPNDQPVDLAGYVIKSGSNLGNSAVLASTVVQPGQYLALTSAVTHLPLANAGSQVVVLDPSGQAAAVAVTYDTAKSGQAWALFDDGWHWTTTPTPNAPNVFTQLATVAVAKPATASKTKSAVAVAATKPKVSSKPTATKSPKVAKTVSSAAPLVEAASQGGGQWLLAGLAGLTIIYIGYEFRHDLRNAIRFRRRHQRLRGKDRPAAGASPRSRAN